MGVRRNMRLLTSVEVARFVAAVKKMKADGVYDWYVETHIRFTVMPPTGMGNVPHAGPGFYPWHRQFLVDFEHDLKQAHVRLDPANNRADEINLPYWNWARDQSTDPIMNRLWESDFMGGSGTPGPTRGRVTTGPFATDVPSGNWRIVHQEPGRPDPMDPLFVGAPVNFLQRGLGLSGVASLPGLTSTRSSIDDPPNPVPPPATVERPYDSDPWDETVAPNDSFRNLGEGFVPSPGPEMHNRVHVWVWGSMITMASPNDPLFFLHHANVDRLWVLWQLKYRPLARDQYPARLPPGPTLATALAAGGTLPLGQHGYEVAAVVGAGRHTARSTERVVSVVVAAMRRATLTWTAVPGATAYLVYRRTPGAGYGHYATVAGGTTTFDDTGAALPVPAPAPRPSAIGVAQPRLAHAFDDPMPPWDGRPDTRPPPYTRAMMPVVRPGSVLNHRSLGYRYRDIAVNVVVVP